MSTDKKQAISKGLFNKQNYLLMLAGLVVLAIGFF